jgi:hypothetical protein
LPDQIKQFPGAIAAWEQKNGRVDLGFYYSAASPLRLHFVFWDSVFAF